MGDWFTKLFFSKPHSSKKAKGDHIDTYRRKEHPSGAKRKAEKIGWNSFNPSKIDIKRK